MSFVLEVEEIVRKVIREELADFTKRRAPVEGPEFLTLAEAAKRASTHTNTIRKCFSQPTWSAK